ncbi:hypothetical protein ACFXPX_36750 [Kitasatospora sp. NPDC059146]|uniref:hypothetical protein n=1 Tax=unclassified Kitasatospora TaxID=2633591 RepID=UPI00367B4804
MLAITIPAAPAAPKHIAEVAAYARKHGWSASVAWAPASPDNDGDGFVMTLSGDTARGSGRFHLEWRWRGGSFAFQRWLSEGRAPAGTYHHPLTLADVRSAVRTSPIRTADGTRQAQHWRAADALPVTADDLTGSILAYAHKAADESWCAWTVWPSRFVGPQFRFGGVDLVTLAAPGSDEWDAPEDAAPGSRPLLTVLPASYFGHRSARPDTGTAP